MIDDYELIRAFAQSGDEHAFAELVQKYTGLVYGIARRKMADTHHAEDVAQAVFLLLSRKAAHMDEKTILPAWLARTTENVVRTLKRTLAREARKQKALAAELAEPSASFEKISPKLDEAINSLGKSYRETVYLHYFMGQSPAEVARSLNISEAAARKRITRSVSKLKDKLKHMQLAVTPAVLEDYLRQSGGAEIKVGLIEKLTSPQLEASTSAVRLADLTQRAATMMKIKMAAATGLAVLLVGTSAAVAGGPKPKKQKTTPVKTKALTPTEKRLAEAQFYMDTGLFDWCLDEIDSIMAKNKMSGVAARCAQLKKKAQQRFEALRNAAWPPSLAKIDQNKFTLAFENQPLPEAIRLLEDVLGVPVWAFLHEEYRTNKFETISLSVKKPKSGRELLNAFCTQANLTFEIKNGTVCLNLGSKPQWVPHFLGVFTGHTLYKNRPNTAERTKAAILVGENFMGTQNGSVKTSEVNRPWQSDAHQWLVLPGKASKLTRAEFMEKGTKFALLNFALRHQLGHKAFPKTKEAKEVMHARAVSAALMQMVSGSLDWMKSEQSNLGHWQAPDPKYNLLVTAQALLMYSSHGDTHVAGKYRAVIKKGLDWILDQQNPDGSFDTPGSDTYTKDISHAAVTYALTDLLTMEDDDNRLRAATELAVKRLVDNQQADGSWHRATDDIDEPGKPNMTHNMRAVMGLMAATHADVKVDTSVFKTQRAWLTGALTTDKDTGDVYFKDANNKPNPKGTLQALLARQFLSEHPKKTKPMAEYVYKHLDTLKRDPESLYAASLAMFQMQGKYWNTYLPKLAKQTYTTKKQAGVGKDQRVWWKGNTQTGDVYATAMNTTALMVFYRYNLVAGTPKDLKNVKLKD